MKKLALTFAIVLGMTVGAFAQEGGLFGKGATRGDEGMNFTKGSLVVPGLPGEFGSGDDQPATPTPLGSGIVALIGFGAAYAMTKKNKK